MPTFLGPTDLFYRNTLLTLRGTNFTGITARVGFLTVGPTAPDGTGYTELVHADYTRQNATLGNPTTGRSISNTAVITFTADSSSQWNGGSLISLFGLWDTSGPSVSPNNLLWCDQINPAFSVAGQHVQVTIGIGVLVLSGTTRQI